MNNWVKVLKEIRSWAILLALVLILSALINSQLFAMATVQEVSMQNTLYAEQKLVVNRLSYRKSPPKKGDIIIFYQKREIGNFYQEFIRSMGNYFSFIRPKEESRDRMVKRVIGVAGDVIDIKDGYVYLNGERLEEPYVKGTTEEGRLNLPITVGENQIFVMGDNRERSMDSRDFGPVDVSHVEGKVSLRIYPFNKFGKVD